MVNYSICHQPCSKHLLILILRYSQMTIGKKNLFFVYEEEEILHSALNEKILSKIIRIQQTNFERVLIFSFIHIYAQHSLPLTLDSRIIIPHSRICINIWFISCLFYSLTVQRYGLFLYHQIIRYFFIEKNIIS